MLPIVAGETHDHFVLTMRPPHCPFCLSLGPEYIVEVKSRRPIKHTYEPVVVAGRLNVLRDDPFGGVLPPDRRPVVLYQPLGRPT